MNRVPATPPVERRGDDAFDAHQMHIGEVLTHFDTSETGLTTAEAADRLVHYGRNELIEGSTRGPWRLLWEQLTAVMVLILIGASLLSLVLGKYLEAGAIGTIVVLFALLGFIQEYRAEKAIAALRRMSTPLVKVTRNGRVSELPAIELVPGDVVLLEAGNVVPADMRLIESAGLRVQEATLTGESEPVDKITDPMSGSELALGDRRNMTYSGTQVTYGRGRGVVVATGMATQLGTIATLLQSVEHTTTPLQQRLDRVGKQLALAGAVVAVLVMILGAVGGEAFSDLILTAISVAVAVIPEGLPAVVTFTLAIGAQRMLRRNALIRKLPAVETLGSVTVICSDKTGTLTQNRMTVTRIVTIDESVTFGETMTEHHGGISTTAELTLAAAALCNDTEFAHTDGERTLIGDPTETALVAAAELIGIDVATLRQHASRLAERPFDSERKRMSTVHTLDPSTAGVLSPLAFTDRVVLVKGAVDGMLSRLTAVWTANGPVELQKHHLDTVITGNDNMASSGLRVLAVAYRGMKTDVSPVDEFLETDLVFLGLIGMIDPPRPEVRQAVAKCTTAGIRTMMITGDHPLTALAIAKDLGIAKDGERAMIGNELEELDEAALRTAVLTTAVFARVSPEHKLRIVDALQAQGAVVSMTGDGVNDAPALRKADIGVAMGITGTDVSKEASDMVLRDDNFATIVAAVEEGRVIYDNLRKFVKFAVAGNIGKVAVMLGWPIPFLVAGGQIEHPVALLPLQLLWLNLMTDGLLGLSLGLEPAERSIMNRSPHRASDSLWAGGLGRQTVWIGLFIGAVTLGVGFVYEAANRTEWQTMMFATLASLQIFQVVGTRSNTDSLRRAGWRSNPTMLAVLAIVAGLQVIAIYTPLQRFLDLTPLPLVDLGVCIGLGALLLITMEISKATSRKRRSSQPAP
jgi:P-type Ca2+ transporter type 2C